MISESSRGEYGIGLDPTVLHRTRGAIHPHYARRLAMLLTALLSMTAYADGSDLPRGFVYLRDVAPDIVQDMPMRALIILQARRCLDTTPPNAF